MVNSKYLKTPWLETMVMVGIILLSYIALTIISFGVETPPGGMSAINITALLFGFFMLSFLIAIIAVIVGIGGGVIFTPIMLAFTPVDSLVVRATGLVVAMFSGLISSGPFLWIGLGNLRMSILMAVAYGSGAFAGAQGAIYIWRYLGSEGEAGIRIVLGLLVAMVAVYFLIGGKKVEWPQVERPDRFTERLNIAQPFYERSLDKKVDYKLTRAGLGLTVTAVVGVISGFFGLGAGWAIVPVQNLILGAPLKVAVANSSILIGMGDSIAVWPYILKGAVIPLFVAPWLIGKVVGGRLGAFLLINIKAESLRYILLGILFFTSYGLITRGLEILEVINNISEIVDIGIFVLIIFLVLRAVFLRNYAEGDVQ